jgi:uncharacterized protein YgiM (DUF1202 family)
MPANTPVWVHKSYIDPANNTVTASRLNLRSGAGENYSILGRLEHGVTVKPIRESGEWIEIEAPAGTYAFVAAEYVDRAGGAVAAVPATPATAPAVATTSTTTPPTPATTPTTEPAPTAPTPVPAAPATPPAPVVTTTSPTPAPSQETPPATPAPAVSPATLPPTAVAAESSAGPLTVAQEERARGLLRQKYNEMEVEKEKTKATDAVALARPERPTGSRSESAAPRRIVTREGVVRPTVSIQAPTPFSLENLETHKLMNFLLSTSTNIQILKLSGSRVIVTGEEAIDKRWPNIPVLKVESVVVMP